MTKVVPVTHFRLEKSSYMYVSFQNKHSFVLISYLPTKDLEKNPTRNLETRKVLYQRLNNTVV